MAAEEPETLAGLAWRIIQGIRTKGCGNVSVASFSGTAQAQGAGMSGPAMLYQEAARLCSWPRDGDWPDKLTVEELARIQFPYVGSSEEKKRALRLRNNLLRLMCKAIIDGTLPAESEVKPPHVARINLQGWNRANGGAGSITQQSGVEFLGSVFPGANVRVGIVKAFPQPAETTVYVIRPQGVAEWMMHIEESPSELVGAWLRAKAVIPASPAPKVAVPISQPKEWSRGVYLVAWEVAIHLMENTRTITGPTLLDGMMTHENITVSGQTLKFKGPAGGLSSREASCKSGTVARTWFKKLKDILTPLLS